MSKETATPAPVESAKESPKLLKAIESLLSHEKQAALETAVRLDTVRKTAKSETTRLKWTGEQLTAALLSGGMDPARATEIKQFVFPKHNASHAVLDKIMEVNANAKDVNKRIGKEIILEVQKDTTGEITIDKAKAIVQERKEKREAEKAAARAARGKTDQQGHTAKKLTPKEQAAAVQTAITAAAKLAKSFGYDAADFAAEIEEWTESFADEIFPAEDGDDEDEKE